MERLIIAWYRVALLVLIGAVAMSGCVGGVDQPPVREYRPVAGQQTTAEHMDKAGSRKSMPMLAEPIDAKELVPWAIRRDSEVFIIGYEHFDDLSPEDLWHEIDAMEFWALPIEPPAGYYDGVIVDSASALRESLHAIISGHRAFPYTTPSRPGQANHRVDVWDIVAQADAHPEFPQTSVLDVYANDTFVRQLSGTTRSHRYDREHVWPKSLGFPRDRVANHAYSDVHHLFAAQRQYNNHRSNKSFGNDEPTDQTRWPTRENLGRGGSLTPEPGSSNYSFSDRWQTWIGRRGDIARVIFYMDIRYQGTLGGATNEPNLILTDDLSLVSSGDVWEDGGDAYHGIFSHLIRWHEQDPVDDLERRRNTVVFLFQGNRNPFVDHPEWVNIVYDEGN